MSVNNDETGPILLEHGTKGCVHLAQTAYSRGSDDNITVLVVDVQKLKLANVSETIRDMDRKLCRWMHLV